MGARVLVVDDDPTIRKIIRDRVRALGHTVEVAQDGVDALEKWEAFEPDLILCDMMMPRASGFDVLAKVKAAPVPPEVVMITAHGTVDRAVEAIRGGAADFIPKPFDSGHLDHVVTKVLESRSLRQRVSRLELELSGRHTLVTGTSPVMRETLALAGRAAATKSTVLLLGESGSGKEVLARHIHQQSDRAEAPFVAVNCAVLGPQLAESELFGHEKGAFTGAHQAKPGRIEVAEGGTLFLDELGELPLEVQARLLRVLQERQYERVGGTQTREADIRIVAATNRDLKELIAAGKFREDLYYRLNVISIRIPPLRERREDVPTLLAHALERHSRELGRPEIAFSDEALALLREYEWPGNVRELHNVVERAVVLAATETIRIHDLPEEVRDRVTPGTDTAAADASANDPGAVDDGGEVRPFQEAVVEAKRRIIRRALAHTGGHQTNAAKLLGMSQPYLARLMKNLDVKR